MNIPVVACIILACIGILALVLIRNRKDRKALEKDMDTDLDNPQNYSRDKEEM